MIADLIEKMRTDGSRRVVPANPAQEDWVVENNNVANMTLYPAAASWYMGANIPGKPRVFMPYVAGVKQYRATCAEIVADNWRGFEFSP
jgi:cyclohexanone monooxygenase